MLNTEHFFHGTGKKKSSMARLTEHCIFRNGIVHNVKNLNVHSNDRCKKKQNRTKHQTNKHKHNFIYLRSIRLSPLQIY